MSQHTRTTLRPARRSEPSSALLERLHSQFPELSQDEVAHAAAGVVALPGNDADETAGCFVGAVAPTPAPRYRA